MFRLENQPPSSPWPQEKKDQAAPLLKAYAALLAQSKNQLEKATWGVIKNEKRVCLAYQPEDDTFFKEVFRSLTKTEILGIKQVFSAGKPKKNTYKNQEFGFSFSYPSWLWVNEEERDHYDFFVGVNETQFGVKCQKSTQTTAAYKRNFLAAHPEIQVKESKEKEINGVKTLWIRSNQGSYYFVVREGIAYHIYCKGQKETIDNILKSFKF